MKRMILASLVVAAFSSVSFAEQFCGRVGSFKENGNNCVPSAGKACPDFADIVVRYTLTVPVLRHGRAVYMLETSDLGVLTKLSAHAGTAADFCVYGDLNADVNTINVTSTDK